MTMPQKVKDTNIFERAAGFSRPRLRGRILISMMTLALLFATRPQNVAAYQDAQGSPQSTGVQGQPQQAQSYTQQTPEKLQQLVAPIALYPDSLVAQIMAASTFPEQVVEADRWVQAHPDLNGDALGQAVDQQSWDPSVKALIAFPSIIGNMHKTLSWTSSLGDAYYNQEQDVMDAVQMMRRQAQESGNLNDTPQQTVTTQGSTIIVEPANSDVVYVPAYNPWVVYGDPIMAWPGWYPYPGIWYDGPSLWFGAGFGIGWFGGYGWGWDHWGCDWHDRGIIHDHHRYYSRSSTFYNRNNYYRGEGARGGLNGNRSGFSGDRGGARDHANAGSRPPNRNFGGRRGLDKPPGATAQPFNGATPAA